MRLIEPFGLTKKEIRAAAIQAAVCFLGICSIMFILIGIAYAGCAIGWW